MTQNKTLILYEYQKAEVFEGKREDLEEFLDNVWQRRGGFATKSGARASSNENDDQESEEETRDEDIKNQQKFLTFLRQGKKDSTIKIKSRNYVGVIHFEGQRLHLLPKIFYRDRGQSEFPIESIHAHILWWLSYSKRFKFPHTRGSFNSIKSDFFEVMIWLFANYTRTTFEQLVYRTYTEVEGELSYLKGRLNFNHYVRNLASGRWHALPCVYDSFEVDNVFNRIVKYVAKLLLHETADPHNKRLLHDIIFALDEVSDVRITLADCDKVRLNPLYHQLTEVLDYCRMFLANSTILSYDNKFKVFAFLLPMEKVFEEFVTGFIEKHCLSSGINLVCQSTNFSFSNRDANSAAFTIRPDMVFQQDGKILCIADAKYKMTYDPDNGGNKKYGVSQADMYQMTSYAVALGCERIILLYPALACESAPSQTMLQATFEVFDRLACVHTPIRIEIHKLPIIDSSLDISDNRRLQERFSSAECKLKVALVNILQSHLPS